MRVASFILISILASAQLADAGRIVLMTDPAGAAEEQAALQVTLRGTEIMQLPPPEGELQLDRVATVERTVAANGADAGVWIEAAPSTLEVCVVSADGRYVRHAPLPRSGSPRVFAAIVTSLLDELLAPPEDALHIDVHVDVTPGGAVVPVAVGMPAVAAAPVVVGGPAAAVGAGPVAVGLPVPAPGFVVAGGPSVAMPFAQPSYAHRTLLEIGPMLSPLTVGLDVEAAFPIGDRLRLGVAVMINQILVESTGPVFSGGLELRRSGPGRRHFDYGLLAGGAVAKTTGVGIIAVPLGYTWEGDTVGFGLTVAPTLVFNADGAFPAIWGAARLELPL